MSYGISFALILLKLYLEFKMDKQLNISESNPSNPWECVRKRLLTNCFIANERTNNITFVNDSNLSFVLNVNINRVDNYELNRVNYNRI